jgi:hypothetical protein
MIKLYKGSADDVYTSSVMIISPWEWYRHD